MATDFKHINKIWKENQNIRVLAYVFASLIVIVIVFSVFSGRHNKISYKGIETNIPEPKSDTNIYTEDKSRNQQITVDKVEGDAVFGDKTVNYNGDTARPKPNK